MPTSKKKVFRRVVLALAVLSVALTGRARASAFVNVDFNGTNTSYTFTPSGTYSGTGAALNDPGTFWNGAGAGTQGSGNPTFTATGLKQSNGTTPTAVTVTLTGPFGVYDVQGQNNNGGGVAQALLNDYAYDQDNLAGSPVSFSINNLPTGASFNLYVYSGGGNFGNSTSFTIGTTTLSLSGGSFASFSNATVSTTGNYLEFTGLYAPSGTIAGTFTGSNSRFSGFELEIIPEPSTLLLWCAGGLLVWQKRWRGRK